MNSKKKEWLVHLFGLSTRKSWTHQVIMLKLRSFVEHTFYTKSVKSMHSFEFMFFFSGSAESVSHFVRSSRFVLWTVMNMVLLAERRTISLV